MATATVTYSFDLPTVGGDLNSWGGFLNGNWQLVEDILNGSEEITPDLGAGWRVSGTGIVATGAEINFLDGVTSNIQTQLGNKQPIDSTLTSVSGKTITAAGFALLDDANAGAQRTTLGLAVTATYSVASQAQAEAGASSSTLMTPFRTRQAIDARTQPLTRIGEVSNTGVSSETLGSSFDLGSQADWRFILLGQYSVTAGGGLTEVLFEVSTNNSTWTTIRTLVSATGTNTEVVDYNDTVGVGFTFRYVRLRFASSSGDYDVKRANIIVNGKA